MQGFIGTLALIRHALRRDRIFWPAWLGLLSIQFIATASAYDGLYPTAASRATLTTTIGSNASLLALYGPAFDLSTAGGFTAWRIYGFALIMAGIMSFMAVVRHTRAEEEAGRLEMLRSGVVGRHAPLTAALALTVVMNGVLGLACYAGLVSIGEAQSGSINVALGFLLVGALFAGVGAVTAQISENARPARGLAATVLGISFLLRAVGDSSGTARWLSWLSPIGWAQQSRPFAGERWWTLLLPAVAAVLLVSVAVALESRRDFASGLRPTPLGPAQAGAHFGSAASLAWRLQRGAWAAWIAGIAVFSGVIGAVAKGVLDLFKDNPEMEEIFRKMGGSTATLIDAYFAAVLPIIGTVATIHAIQAVLRLRAEETDLRVEQVLATATTRRRLLASHLLHVVVSPFVLMLVAGSAAGAAYALSIGDSSQVGRLTLAATATVPAMLVMAGLATALLGLTPQLTSTIWAALGAAVLIGQIGPLLKMPSWSLRISPFGDVPSVPGGHVSVLPLAILSAVAIVFFAAGLLGFQRRDIG